MRTRTSVALLTAVAVVAGACSSDDGPAIETAEVVAAEVVQTVAAPARLEPRDRRSVTASVPGEIVELLVEDGDEVQAGDEIVRLTSDTVDLAVVQARSAVDAAGSLAGVSLAPDLSPLVGAVRAQLEATLGPLIATLSSQAQSIEDPQLREQALAQVARLVSSYEDTRQRLRATERDAQASTANASAAQRAAAEAQKDQAEAALSAAEGRQDQLVLVAPIGGIVELGRGGGVPDLGGGDGLDSLFGGAPSSDGPLAVGSLVAPGQVLFTVYDLGGFHALATVDEIDVVLLSVGQRATVLVDAYPDEELDGFVSRIAVAPERSNAGGVVYPVEVRLTELPRDVSLRVGLTASVEIVVRTVASESVVPSSALRRRGGGEVVLVARDGVVRVVPVEVEAIGLDTAAVTGELRSGDEVIVRGADGLEDGDPVP